MAFVATEEQSQAQDMARRFFADNDPIALLRVIRDQGPEDRGAPELWRDMAALGLPAAALPQELGGIGIGFRGLGAILEEAGRTLTPSPLFATAVVGASAIELAGNDAQKTALLPLIAEGVLTLAFAHEEGTIHAPWAIATHAITRDGYHLSGTKRFVNDAPNADQIIIVARTAEMSQGRDGLSLFLLARDTPGLRVEPLDMVDSRAMGHVILDDVQVGEDALLGPVDGAGPIIDIILDRARACQAAEMLGQVAELFDRTIDYLGQREQFGVKIGSFQALKHRAAQLFTEIELTRSAVYAALTALDDEADDAAALACLAKVKANDTLQRMSNEAVQMHGGVGVTDELDIGLFLKRSRISIQNFGSSAELRARYATLYGY